MVRVVRLPAGGWRMLAEEDRPAVLAAQAAYLAEPDGGLLEELREAGVRAYDMPAEGVPDGCILVLNSAAQGPLYELVAVVDRLLGPGGCPWDQAQTHETLKRYLLEEAYEVLDAIDAGSGEKLREELGDLLLQPVLHAQMRKAAGEWGTDDVAREIVDKLVRRHPHVFGEISVSGADEVLANWDRIKAAEKGAEAPASRLAGVPSGMASLLRAYEVSKRAVRAGFEWPDLESVFDKLREEELELREAIASGDKAHVEAEVGDLLFTAVNLARWAGVEPEEALRKMLNRFTERFQRMEAMADAPLEELSLAEWDALWERSKAQD